MNIEIIPVTSTEASPATKTFSMPPDKSILHRVLIIGSLTQSAFTIPIPSPQAISHDVVASVLALESLGVPIELFADHIELQGVGRYGYRMPTHLINCANSGTTARLLMGLLAGQRFNSALTGDGSLSRRPMKRLADQLAKMDSLIVTAPDGTLPLMINGRQLQGAEIALPVASAQMKTALLLAAFHCDSPSYITEPGTSRDHTERMMTSFGFGIVDSEEGIGLDPAIPPDLQDEVMYEVPGDLSSAAFLIVASILLKRNIVIHGVSLNPTRSRFLDILTLMGVEFLATNIVEHWNEPFGDLTVFADRVESLRPFSIGADDVPLLIDELPILAMIAAFAEGTSSICGAAELRLKESDRLRLLGSLLSKFGVTVTESIDGLNITGVPSGRLTACEIDHENDHRIAMAFSVASLMANDTVHIEAVESVNISYPGFYEHLAGIAGEQHIIIC